MVAEEPVVPATWEAEMGGEYCLNLGGWGCSELWLHHCTPAWVSEQDPVSKTRNKYGQEYTDSFHQVILH